MNNYNEVKKSFGTQAEKFASYHMSKAEYTDYLIRSIQAKGNEHALEVAAGTCICGRAVAPYVKDITCLDLTEAMILSILVDTFISKISFPMQPGPEIGSISDA
jgi:predicted TPR repeat methyltransferase